MYRSGIAGTAWTPRRGCGGTTNTTQHIEHQFRRPCTQYPCLHLGRSGSRAMCTTSCSSWETENTETCLTCAPPARWCMSAFINFEWSQSSGWWRDAVLGAGNPNPVNVAIDPLFAYFPSADVVLGHRQLCASSSPSGDC